MKIARARIALAVLLLAAAAVAQEPLAGPLPPELQPQALAQGRAEAEALTGEAEAEARAAALGYYDEVDQQLASADQWAAQATETLRQRQSAPASLEEVTAKLAEPLAETPAIPANESVADLDQRVRQAEADLAARQQQLQDLDRQQSDREERQPRLPTLITEARSRRQELESSLASELASAPPEGEDPVVTTARRARTRARMRALQNEVVYYEALLSDTALWGNLLAKRRELAAREVGAAERTLKAWRDELNRRRSEEAEKAQREAAAQAAQVLDNDLVKEIAAQNAADAQTRTDLAEKIQTAAHDIESSSQLLAGLNTDFASTRAKVDAAGLTSSIGFLLVDERVKLKDFNLRDYRARLARRAEQLSEMRYDRIRAEERLESLVDPAAEAERRVAEAAPTAGVDSPEEIRDALREQLVRQREQLDKLLNDYETYIGQLRQLESNQTNLIDLIGKYRDYINELIFWVRTSPPIWEETEALWTQTTQSIGWLLDPSAWTAALTGLAPWMLAEWDIGPPLFALLVLLLLRGRSRRALDDTAVLVSRIRTDRFVYTLRALALTTLVAVALPLLMWMVGSLLEHCAADGGPARAVGQGLRETVPIFLVLQLVQVACRPKGLADAHFRWPARDVQLMRRHLRWFVPLLVPLLVVLAATVTDGAGAGPRAVSVGRLAYIAAEVVTAAFFFAVFRPQGGVLTTTMERHPNGWLNRFRLVWFPLVVGLPLLNVGMAVLGYLVAAKELDLRVEESILLALVLAMVNALALRWLFVARRQLVLKQHVKRREAALAAAAEEERGDESGKGRTVVAGAFDEPSEDEIDLPAVSAQTQRLLEFTIAISLLAGVFFIWSDALPALKQLEDGEQYELWNRIEETVETTTDPVTKTTRRILGKDLVPVTPIDLLMAIIYLVFTVVATRNLPGLLEILVLQRLPIQRAGRYAVTTITRYIIAVIGIALVFSSLGIGWAKVQWLAAAVSVGLGFGLQEIFANFVSGLIILFERPIRVGDTVTVGDVIGTVGRIQMRATTIVTWDRTELVVPNKEFVTAQLVNWTLSDSVLRVVLKVGIAYGSDIEKAERILQEIVRDEPEVLDDPPPRIIFSAFGDSTLDFELRLYVNDPELYRTIAHKVNKAIDRRFHEEGVEIAFPQRDLHLRSADVPLTILRREGDRWVEAPDSPSS